jgi:hypothetical protein
VPKKATFEERIAKLNRELDNMLIGENQSKETPEQLRKFGLTTTEAKAWLKQEPNYIPTDDFLHRKRTDGDLTESAIVFSEH